MSETVWMTRHGNRQDFVDPDWPKSADLPHDPDLSPDGIVQAQRLGERLSTERIRHIFASPFLRTVHTASIVANVLDLPIYLEPGIAEWMNPEWFPGMPDRLHTSALLERFPRIVSSYEALGTPSFPETEQEALRRAGWTARCLAETYEEPILLVGHGASVTGAATGLVPGVEVTECALCSIFRAVRRGGEWHLDLCGDVSHLDDAAASERFH